MRTNVRMQEVIVLSEIVADSRALRRARVAWWAGSALAVLASVSACGTAPLAQSDSSVPSASMSTIPDACSASRLSLAGPPSWNPGLSVQNGTQAWGQIAIVNHGPACHVQLPTTLAVWGEGAAGVTAPVEPVYLRKHPDHSPLLKHGATLELVVGNSMGPPCQPVTDKVTAIGLPMGEGTLRVPVTGFIRGTPWGGLCEGHAMSTDHFAAYGRGQPG